MATGRESESLREALAARRPGRRDRRVPGLGDAAARAPEPERRDRRQADRRAAPRWRGAQADPQHPIIVVACVRAALQPLADNLTELEPIALDAGGRGYNLVELAAQLVDLAYTRVDMVTRRGEFAVRGGILDVFAPTDEHPVRVEFFGDEIEQIRQFSVADQRSLPRAILPSPSCRPAANCCSARAVRQRAREMQHEFPSLAQMLAKIAEGIPVDGMESLAPALLDRLVPLTHYLPADAAIAVLAPERVASRALSLAETNREFLAAAWNAATAGAEAPIDLDCRRLPRDARAARGRRRPPLVDPEQLRQRCRLADAVRGSAAESSGLSRMLLGHPTRETSSPSRRRRRYIRIEATAVPSFAGQADGAIDHVAARLADGWSVAVVAQGVGLVERAADVLAERGLAARNVDDFPAQTGCRRRLPAAGHPSSPDSRCPN